MTDPARLQAAIDALTRIAAGPSPADAVLGAYFRERRFIGSKDRGAVAGAVYGVIRAHARIGWHLERVGAVATPRMRALALEVLARGHSLDEIRELCDGSTYAPAPLSSDEETALASLEGSEIDDRAMPEGVRLECPEWAEAELRLALGPRFREELLALNTPAPLDLRTNPLQATREQVRDALANEGIDAIPTPLSPFGLRVEGRVALPTTVAFQDGWVEVQDEGSQLAALLVEAAPGMTVLDFCAGAGGKTLTIAAAMANRGRIVATDTQRFRLERAAPRLRRAGVHNVERRPIASARDPWLKRHKERFDRVLIDAPCTGVGAWRRNPDAKWGRGAQDLTELVALQREILDSAARFVRPGGGRLVYVTCSMLRAENEATVEAFLVGHREFTVLPVATAWARLLAPAPCPATGPFLRLSPALHGTDGFFVAILERGSKLVDSAQPEAVPEA